MTHLRIELNTGLTEEVDSSLIAKLYECVINGELDNTSDLKGRLHSLTGYETQVDYLNNNFQDLTITVDNKYALLLDPVLASVFATRFGDGTGVTSVQLSTANMTRTTMNEIIASLDDFVLTDMRDFKRVGIVGNTATDTIGKVFNTNKTKNVIHGYVPGVYNGIFTGSQNSMFGTALTDIEVADTVTTFGNYCFYNCSNLLMDKIPDCVTELSGDSFNGCSKITISDTNNVTFIGSGCFSKCTSITSFTIKNICGINAGSLFWGCTNLEEVIFEPGDGPDITFRGEGGWDGGWFAGTKITTLDLPARVVSFGNASLNCSTLRTLIIRKTTVPTKGSWSLNSNVQIYVPDASLLLYKDAWTDLASRIHPISELPS